MDNREAAHLAVDHLAATGHTRVTYADGHPDSWVANVRWRAILGRAAEHGAAHRIVDARARLASRPLADLLDELGGAVIVHSERFAKDAIRHLRGLGASVPGDACVVSFDDLPDTSDFHPSLTTVGAPVKQLGVAAVRLLVDLIDGRRAPAVTRLPTHLVVRESTARGAMTKDGAP